MTGLLADTLIRKWLMAILAGLICWAGQPGQAPAAGQDPAVLVWATNLHDTRRAAVAAFEAEHPHARIRILPIATPWKLYLQCLYGQCPDVITFFQVGAFQTFARNNLLLPLPTERPWPHYAALRDYAFRRGDGAHLAEPQVAYPYLLFYNQDLVDPEAVAAIRTWDDLAGLAASAARRAGDQRRDGQPVFGLDVHSDLVWFQTWLWQRDGELAAGAQSPDNQKAMAETLAAMAAWRGLPGLLPRPQDRLHLPSQGASQGVLGSLFLQGRAVFYWSGSWKMWDLAQQTRVTWGVRPIPRGPRNAQTLMGGNSFAVFRGTRQAELATRFVQHLASRTGQEAHLAAGIYFPSRPDLAAPPPACAVRGALHQGRTQDYDPRLNEALLEDSLHDVLEAHRLGRLDADQAAGQIERVLRSADSGDRS